MEDNMNEVEHILAIKNELGEGPLWNPEEQALYWVDIYGHCFHRLCRATGEHQVFEVGLPIGVLAFRASGGLVMATQNGFAFWDAETQALRFIADPEADRPDARFNDGAVDRQGRFWAGTMGQGPTGSLYRLDPDGSVHRMESGITVANGIGWSLDDKVMYFTDSPLHIIYAYDFDPAAGEIENRRPFIYTPDEEGNPDGLTVDSEGFIWSARWGGWKVSRYDPAGKLEREVHVPTQYPTSCTFGGKQMDELYITSAWTLLNEQQRRNQPWAGDLFRLKTDTRGLEEPKFAG
jgi:sugar lactone lactonase YvrE